MSSSTQSTSSPLNIQLQERGSTLLLTVSGMAAVEVATQFSRALQEAANKKPKVLAVDLSGLSFVSSTGLGGMVAVHITCQRHGIKLFVINPKPFIKEILEVTRLSNLFKICDTVEEAEQLAAAGK